MQLYNKKYDLTPTDDKTNIIIPFAITTTIQALQVTVDYTPRLLSAADQQKIVSQALYDKLFELPCQQEVEQAATHVQNLITASLVAPSGYIGCRHYKENKQQIEITTTAASLGYLPVQTLTGEWQLIMNLHCIASSKVQVNIQIDTY